MLGASSLGEDFIIARWLGNGTQNVPPGSPTSCVAFMTLPLRLLGPEGLLSRMSW